MKPLLLGATGVPNLLFKVGPRESARLVNSASGTHAQKTTDWPFVLEFLVDFVHFGPSYVHRSPFGGRILYSDFCLLNSDLLLAVPAERYRRWSL